MQIPRDEGQCTTDPPERVVRTWFLRLTSAASTERLLGTAVLLHQLEWCRKAVHR